MKNVARTDCPACTGTSLKSIFVQEKVPACANVPLTPSEFADELLGRLDIVMCADCSHVFNRAFDSDIVNRMYAQQYSSGVATSEGVSNLLKHVAEKGIGRDNLDDSIVVEIGASNFAFSQLMLTYGARKVLAFEPSALFRVDNPRISHRQCYFSLATFDAKTAPVDLVVARHVLEHAADPVRMLADIASILRIGGSLYLEVPNVDDILKGARVYDFFYEHVHYFSPALLSKMVKRLGFQVEGRLDLKGGQHFGLLCRNTGDVGGTKLARLRCSVPGRAGLIAGMKEAYSDFLAAIRPHFDGGGASAIYGAGNHAIATTIYLGLTDQTVRCLFDINPLKAGRYSPMSHIPIQTPSVASVREMDKIVIIASLHEIEINKHLRERYRYPGIIVGTYPSVRVLE